MTGEALQRNIFLDQSLPFRAGEFPEEHPTRELTASYLFDMLRALVSNVHKNQRVDQGNFNSGSGRKIIRIVKVLLKLGVDATIISTVIAFAVLTA